MRYMIDNQQVTKAQAENHFIGWCLSVGANMLNVNAISAMRAFNAAMHGDNAAMACVIASGINITN